MYIWPPNSDVSYISNQGILFEFPGDLRETLVVTPSGKQESDINLSKVPGELRYFQQANEFDWSSLRNGLYFFKVSGLTKALVVAGFAPSYDRDRADLLEELMATDFLVIAFDILNQTWDKAESPDTRVWNSGDWVAVRKTGQFARIAATRITVNGLNVDIDLDGQRITFDGRDLEILEGDPKSLETWVNQQVADPKDFAALISHVKLTNPLTNTFYSYAATRTVFKPYQFLPALKMIRSARGRLLIADEVGLGKTIEAGLVWAELEQRHKIDRALIVVPASLTTKWKTELRNRFMREVPVWGRTQFKEFLDKVATNPEEKCTAIVSIESLRGSDAIVETLEGLGADFDFVVVDEAHTVRNSSGRGYKLVSALSSVCEFMILMSATPLNLGQNDFFNLVNLLEPDLFPDQQIFREQLEPNNVLNLALKDIFADKTSDAMARLESLANYRYGKTMPMRDAFVQLTKLVNGGSPYSAEAKSHARQLVGTLNTLATVVNRTRKIDVPSDKAIREARDIEVTWTAQERAFYDAVYSHFLAKASKLDVPSGFLLQMPLRQTCSSIPVMRKNLHAKGEHDLARFAEENDLPEALAEDEENYPEVLETNAELELMLGSSVTVDSKLEALKQLLADVNAHGMRQVLIFSFFRGTVEYLKSELSSQYSVGIMHGGIAREEREQTIADFRASKIDILVANQVGSEGLDFQFCNVLVNYDLPWNPMQIEQRIGRLDRFGQENEKIFIYNMAVPGTIETDIIGRLYQRIKIFESSVGDLEPILQSVFEDISKIISNPKLTQAQRIEQAEARAIQLATERIELAKVVESNGLIIPGNLEVEGLSETGPRAGRYVGAYELRNLLSRFLARHGGYLVEDINKDGLLAVIGNEDISRMISNLDWESGGSTLGFALNQRLRTGTPIKVIFDSTKLKKTISNDQSEGEIEIMSTRHPLIRCAVREENEFTLLSSRFASLRLEGKNIESGKYLALFQLARGEGITDTFELWVTGINLQTGLPAAELEGSVLEAIATGVIEYVEKPELDFSAALSALQTRSDMRRTAEAEILQRENLAQIAARRESEMQILDRKISRFSANIERNLADERIIRMNRSQLEKALSQKAAKELDYETKASAQLTVQTFAIGYLEVN